MRGRPPPYRYTHDYGHTSIFLGFGRDPSTKLIVSTPVTSIHRSA
jgi:hypothetical protein